MKSNANYVDTLGLHVTLKYSNHTADLEEEY